MVIVCDYKSFFILLSLIKKKKDEYQRTDPTAD